MFAWLQRLWTTPPPVVVDPPPPEDSPHLLRYYAYDLRGLSFTEIARRRSRAMTVHHTTQYGTVDRLLQELANYASAIEQDLPGLPHTTRLDRSTTVDLDAYYMDGGSYPMDIDLTVDRLCRLLLRAHDAYVTVTAQHPSRIRYYTQHYIPVVRETQALYALMLTLSDTTD